MRRLQWTAIAAGLLITATAAVTAIPVEAGPAPSSDDRLDVYVGALDNRQWDMLRTAGLAADELGRAPIPGRKATVNAVLAAVILQTCARPVTVAWHRYFPDTNRQQLCPPP
jgi:hypothetical protein